MVSLQSLPIPPKQAITAPYTFRCTALVVGRTREHLVTHHLNAVGFKIGQAQSIPEKKMNPRDRDIDRLSSPVLGAPFPAMFLLEPAVAETGVCVCVCACVCVCELGSGGGVRC